MKALRYKNLDAISQVQDLISPLGLSKGPALFTSFLILTCLLAILCWMANFIARRYLANFINSAAIRAYPVWGKSLQKHRFVNKLALLAPAIVIYFCAPFFVIPRLKVTSNFVDVLFLFNQVYATIAVGLALNSFLSTFEDIYNTYSVANRAPIKSYVQVGRIILFFCISLFAVSIWFDLSPWTFLTGLGAATAVILLIFKDVILGFVASIHISSYDIVRLGDWIEMSQYGVDGNVIEISLSTVKVRNFDKTITSVPTYALISSGVKSLICVAKVH